MSQAISKILFLLSSCELTDIWCPNKPTIWRARLWTKYFE